MVCILLSACADTGMVSSSQEGRESSMELPQADAAAVHSVQLHPMGNETGPAVLINNGSDRLRLAFDLVEEVARPLTAFFYHANKDWELDLSAGEVLGSFHYEDLLEYRPSLGTIVPYIHYEYAFPTTSISFKVSGNYVLRITEQGREDLVLFERRFVVAEQSIPVEISLDDVMVAGSRGNTVLPIVRFDPSKISSNAFDYTVCFVQNNSLTQPRCTDRPSMDVQPNLVFYLEPENGFRPAPSPFFLDLTDLRVGYRIERVNQQQEPWRILIEPDNARFPGSQLAPSLFGNSVIRSSNSYINEPDYRAEYVLVDLSIQPPDRLPIPQTVFLEGSFSNWKPVAFDSDQWDAELGGYRASILLKQGQHEYTYTSANLAFNRALHSGLPQLNTRYYAFIYYRDAFSQTDRLLSVKGIDAN